MGSRRRMPWACTEEWIEVYNLAFSEDVGERNRACKRMMAWRSRGNLPLSVDATFSLLSAQCLDGSCAARNTVDDTPVRSTYGVALMRFVNTFTEFDQTGVYASSVQLLASRLGIPEWVVDARHSVAHRDLPGIEVLRGGAQVCLQWLRDHYWKSQLTQWREAEARVVEVVVEFSEKAREAVRCQLRRKKKKRKKKRQEDDEDVQVNSTSSQSAIVSEFLPSCRESFSVHRVLATEMMRLSEVLFDDDVKALGVPKLSDLVNATSLPLLHTLPDCVLTLFWPLLKWCQSVGKSGFFMSLIEEFAHFLHFPQPTGSVDEEAESWWQRHVIAASWVLTILSEARKSRFPQQRILKVESDMDVPHLLECFLCPEDAAVTTSSVFCSSIVQSVLDMHAVCTHGGGAAVDAAVHQRILELGSCSSKVGHCRLLMHSLNEYQDEDEQMEVGTSTGDPDLLDWSQIAIGQEPHGLRQSLELPARLDDPAIAQQL